ncbi:hypothetical protein SSX86_019656 [Deinandra increscens subsp. villosa]|uniref:ATP-dependent DNA helicase n=1 Tax=Deinandra increscens subsp. villosa TaxID=3103831 RepID=A0AAP0CT20_9ASTR
MRLEQPNLDSFTRERVSSFSSWLLDIGNGCIGTIDKSDPSNCKQVSIPEEFLIPNSQGALAALIEFIYDSESLQNPNPKELSTKAIVCPRNDTVDEGTAIEAKVQPRKKKFDSQVRLYNCYNIDGYAVDPNIRYRQVVPQTSTIVIGDRTVFKAINEIPIPRYHFNFVAYKDLSTMQKQSLLLTDYLCRVEATSPMMKRKDYNLMKISAIDLSGHVIEITLWEDIGYTYVTSVSAGMVIAITSLIVTTYEENLQLESTSATTIDIEPPLEAWKEQMQTLKKIPRARTLVYGPQTEEDIRNNMTTLQNVVSMNSESTHVSSRYCVNATLDDGNASLAVVFFDDAMTHAIGIDCETMVVKHGYDNEKAIPEPILSLVGQQKIYSFLMRKNADASIQQTIDIEPTAGTQHFENVVHQIIPTDPKTPAAKPSRKRARDNEGTEDSSDEESSRQKKTKKLTFNEF